MATIKQPQWLSPEDIQTIRENAQQYQMLNPGAPMDRVLQVDEQGRPFMMHKGKKVLMSPAHWDQSMIPRGGGGLVHGGYEWDEKKGEWHTPVSFNKLAALGTGAILTAGAANAIMAPAVTAPTTAASVAPTVAAPAAGVGIGETGAVVGLGGSGFGTGTGAAVGAGAKLKEIGKKVIGAGKDKAAKTAGELGFGEIAKLAGLQGGLGILGDLLSRPPQERRPFAGAQQSLDFARDSMRSFMPTLQNRASSPVNMPRGPRTPSMSFSGGPLPFKVGLDQQTQDPIEQAQNALNLFKMGQK